MNYVHTNPNGTGLILYNTSHRYRPVTSNSRLIRLFTGAIDALRTLYHVGQLIKREKPDVIHLASSASLSLFKDDLLVKKARKHQIPIVLHWHFGRIPQLMKQNNWEWKLLLSIIRNSSMSIVIDNSSYKTLLNLGVSNLKYVPNPLAINIEQKARAIDHANKHRQAGRVIFVGHIIRNKGVFELVDACSKIPHIKELLLIGPYEEQIKTDLMQMAGEDATWLKFTGPLSIDEVIGYMRSSPMLILPSYTEGFPMVILEAMAMGCAVIATDVGAIPEMLNIHSDTPCGLCIVPQQTAPLKQAIEELIGNNSAVEMYGQRATKRVLDNYTIAHVFSQYKSVWELAVHTCRTERVDRQVVPNVDQLRG